MSKAKDFIESAEAVTEEKRKTPAQLKSWLSGWLKPDIEKITKFADKFPEGVSQEDLALGLLIKKLEHLKKNPDVKKALRKYNNSPLMYEIGI